MPRPRGREWFAPLVVVAATLAAHFPALFLGFTNWDDADYVTKCTYIKYMTWENAWFFLTSFYFSNYHPLTSFSYMVEYWLWRLNPMGFHAVNLALHAGVALMVWLFALVLTRRPWVAMFVALAFALHPQRVEVAAWVAARKDLLCALFLLPSLTLWVVYARTNRQRYLGWSLVFFVASALSKSMAVTLPVVLLLLDQLLGRKWSRSLLIEKIPFFVVSALLAVVTVLAQRAGGSIRVDMSFAWWIKLQTVAYGLVFYIGKALWPTGLSPLYPYGAFYEDVLPPAAYFAPFVLAALAALAFFASRRSRWWRFGVLMYVVMLAPVIQLVPIGGAYAADRYTYLPMLGLTLAAVVGIASLGDRAGRWGRHAAVAGGVVILAVWGTLTFRYTRVWKDGVTLWEYATAVNPRSHTGFNNLGAEYMQNGENQLAFLALNRAISLYPDYALAYNNRGNYYVNRGDLERALQDYEHATRLAPQHAPPYNNIGTVLGLLGREDEAIEAYTTAIGKSPFYSEAYVNRSMVLRERGETEAALKDLLTAVEINPNMPIAYNDLGMMLAGLGQMENAERMFMLALRYAPGSPEILSNRGTARKQAGLYAEAVADFERASALGLRTEDLFNNWGGAVAEQGQHDRAIELYTMALDINTSSPAAYCNRGTSLMKKGELAAAMADLNRAIELYPEMIMAYKNRGILHSMKQDIPAAIDDFSRAIELSPEFSDALINRAANYFIMKDYERAWADVRALRRMGAPVHADFVRQLQEASGIRE